MARIFITGSTDGLGLAAARALLDDGHEVVLHARTRERALAVTGLEPRAGHVVTGDLSRAAEVRGIAEQVNAVGRMDAINTLAPFILTALIERPDRLVYLSSGLHRGGEGSLKDIDWTQRSWDTAKA